MRVSGCISASAIIVQHGVSRRLKWCKESGLTTERSLIGRMTADGQHAIIGQHAFCNDGRWFHCNAVGLKLTANQIELPPKERLVSIVDLSVSVPGAKAKLYAMPICLDSSLV